MDPEIQEVFQKLQTALDAGEITEADADELASQFTEHPNYFGLRMAVESAQDAQASEEMREIGENPVRSFAGSAAQGATLGFADEIVGLLNEDAGARLRGGQERREEHAPVADIASQVAGGFGMAGGAGAASQAAGRLGAGARGLMNMFAPMASGGRAGAVQGLLSGAARGGVTGSLAGGAAGAGFARPGERLEGAGRGALFGGATGAAMTAPFGAVAGLLGSRAARGARIADDLIERAEVPTTNRVVARGRIEDAKEIIQDIYYRPLEEGGEAIMDPVLNQTVAELSGDDLVGNVISQNLRGRIGPMAAGETIEAGEGIMFAEAQQIRRDLREIAFDFQSDAAQRKAARRAADQIDEAMQDALGEPLVRADAAWRRVSDRERALEQGIRMANARSEEIRGALMEMSGPQRQAFNQGRLSEIVADLTTRNKEAVPRLQEMLDAGPETLTAIRDIFPPDEAGDAAFEAFQNVLRSQASQDAIAEGARRILQSSAVGILTGAVAGGVAGRALGGGGGGN